MKQLCLCSSSYLYSFSQVISLALFVDDMLINFAGRDVVVPMKRHVQKSE